ncbi:MAG: imidazolonepropionase [Pseudomonadota bacterium]
MTTVLKNARLATLTGSEPYGLIEDASLVIEDGSISWVGETKSLPKQFNSLPSHDVSGNLITPALIDCHTHLVFGGDRAREFEQRLLGVSYEEIARSGGGILSTVNATRNASLDELIDAALPRLDALISEGVATVEIKSGYGLDIQTELNMLRAARSLASRRNVRVETSFLGAHAVPPEFKDRADAYIDDVCIPALKEAVAEGLVDCVDGFCENIAFSAAQIERVLKAARELEVPVKLHAEQLSHQGGTALAAQYGALSADHVEYATDDDARLMAASQTVAVILPGAFYTLNETQKPPVEAFRKHKVPMAIATDANPGSSPLFSPLLAMNMSCTLFKLTPQEALEGVTKHAAKALGLDDCGVLEPGKRADFAIWNVNHPAELAYTIGFNPLTERWVAGECI